MTHTPSLAGLQCDSNLRNEPENLDLINHGIPPIVYDDVNTEHRLTARLITLMKKQIRLQGDKPKLIAIDGTQFFDVDKRVANLATMIKYEDFYSGHFKETFGLDWALLPRDNTVKTRNRFCIMVGEKGKLAIGSYALPD